MAYSNTNWNSDKILVITLLKNGKMRKARDFLHNILLCMDVDSNMRHECSGMLFILEWMIHKEKWGRKK